MGRRDRDLALLCVLVVAACGGKSETRSRPPRPSTAPSPTTVSAIYDHLTVRHPSAWRLVLPLAFSAGPSGTVAYLTDQPNTSHCSTSTEPNGAVAVACYPPVSTLPPNGIFITFQAEFQVEQPPRLHNRVLDGHLATVQSLEPGAAFCVPGATDAVRMSVFIPNPNAIPAGSGQTVWMTACYGGPQAAPIKQDIDAMIDSVVFL